MTWKELTVSVYRRLRRYTGRCLRIDTRSLALFRMGLGLLIIADMLLRARNFGFYYTDDGVVPAELAARHTADHAISVYFLTSDPYAIAALFVLQALVGLSLAIGYRTRAATVCSFLFVVSLDHHNPFVLSYADTLFRLLLFWAIFLPLGERWSVDAVHSDGLSRRSVGGIAAAFALFQMVVMYVVNGVHKLESSLWRSGEAAPLVFGIDEMTFLLGNVVRQYPLVLELGGLLWLYMLLGAWLLVLLPGRPRAAFLSLFVGGHLSFALTVRIGAFAYVALVGLLLFIPAAVWDDVETIRRRVALGRVSDRLVSGGARLAVALPDVRVVPQRYSNVKTAAHTVALTAVVVALGIVVILFALNFGTIVTDDGYDQRALNQHVSEHTAGSYVHATAESVGIVQPEWSVFAPHPRTTDRYYVFGARTSAGEQIDVFNDRPFTWNRPYDGELQRQHDTYRQRFFMNSVRRAGQNDELPANFAEHICQQYRERGIELQHISMFEVTERITAETITAPEDRDTERTHLHRHRCSGS